MLKGSKVAFFSVTDIHDKTSIIKNVFFTFKINPFLSKTSPKNVKLHRSKFLQYNFYYVFLQVFLPILVKMKLNFSLKFVYVTQNFH